jgi:hypothetical protein
MGQFRGNPDAWLPIVTPALTCITAASDLQLTSMHTLRMNGLFVAELQGLVDFSKTQNDHLHTGRFSITK